MSSGGSSYLHILPATLNFAPPLTTKRPQKLELHNITTEYITFKIRTTAPTRYAVKPNIGIIKPRETVIVPIVFNAMNTTEVPSKSDTFLILSMAIDIDDLGADPKSFWNQKSERKQCSQKVKATFNTVTPATNEPDIVETIQRQNDQLSKQVAQVENENTNLRASVHNLNEQIADKESKKEDMVSALQRYQSTSEPITAKPRSHTKELLRLLIIFLLFLVIGYLLA